MSANKHVLICVLWAFSTFGIFAQNYPIQTTVQLLPPYTPRLTELQSEPNRLSVSLLNKDLATPVVEVYLSLRLQGPGVGLQTRSGYRPLKTFTLNAGVPISINGPDLAELLQPQNLDFQGLDRNAFIRGGQLLPEGLWTISISAYSVARNLQVSNTGVVMAGLFKHKPPLLNFPFHESRAGSALPQFLPFQWTSRHYASPFAAGSIRYRFKMIELIPGSRNPNEAMQATAIPWFETFTEQTSYIYGPADPPLVPGRSYAWQVQAIDVDGSEGFENEGYSQVFSFVFGETCAGPLGIRARAEEGRTIRVLWTPIPGIVNVAYSLWYRTKGIGEWQTFMVTDTVATVGGLLPDTEYEVYVNRICIGGESPPTATITVTTDALRGAWDEVSKQCGKPAPTFDLSNRKPLLALEPGETFTAADFTIKVLSATGVNGEFSGSGTVWLPFTGKVPIPCTWEHVSINSDRRLVDGMVKILRKPLVLSNLTFEKLADRWRDLFGSNWNRSEYKRIAVPVSDVEVLPDGRIRIRMAKGDEFARGGQNTVIEGPDGKRWYVSAGGKVTGPEGPAEKPVVGNESNGSGMPGSVLPDGTMVLFDNDDPNRRAWDAYNIRSETGGSSYDRLDGPPGGYVAGWKLLATGEKETVRATLRKGKLKLHPDSIRFLRSDGVRIKSERINDTVWKLEVPGRLHLWADAVWAVGSIVPPDSVRGGARRVLGKLNLIAADERKVHVKLVPVGSSGGTISKGQLETALNVITAKFGVKTGVEVMPSMAVSGYNPQVDKISVNRMVLKTSYGSDLQRFIREYEGKYRSPRSDTAVMLLLGPAADQTEGYMALNNRYGFIFCGNSPPEAHTLAHELGHGLLVLEHPFEESAEQVGKTLNLMDYRKPHALTHFKQWKRIHDKEEVGNFLRAVSQKEEEGRYVATRYTLNDAKIFTDYKNLDNAFIDPAGRVVERIDYKADNAFVARVLDNNYPYVVTALKVYRINGENYELINEYKSEFNEDGMFQGYANFTGVLKYATGNILVPVFIIKSSCYYLKQKINYQNNGKIKKYEDLKIEIAPLINYKGWHPELFLMADASCYTQFKKELSNSNECKDDSIVISVAKNISIAIDSLKVKTESNFVNLVLKSCQSSLALLPWYKLRKGIHYLVNTTNSRAKQMAVVSLLYAGLTEHSKKLDSLFKSQNYELTKKVFAQFDQDLLCGKDDEYTGFLGSIGASHVKNFVNTYPDFIMDYYEALGENEKQEFIVALATAIEPVWDRDAEIIQVHIYDKNNNDLPSGIEKHTAGCVQYTNGKFRIGKSTACFSVTDNGFLACDKTNNYKYSDLKFIHDFTANCESVNEFYPSDPTLVSTGDGYIVLPAVISGKMIMDKIYDSYWEIFKANISLAMPAILKTSGAVAGKTLSSVVGGFGRYSTAIDNLVNEISKVNLPPSVVNSFTDGIYRSVITTSKVKLYRGFGAPNAYLRGAYSTTLKNISRNELAILDEWGNSLRFEAEIEVPIGKVLNIGKVKKQISSDGLQVLSGGADQVVLPTNWDLNTWVTKVVDKQTGLLYSYEEFLKAFPNLISK